MRSQRLRTIGSIGGQATIRTASGDVAIAAAAGDTIVSSASGDQEIGSVTAGRVDLRSASGDIEVGIAKGSNVWVDARAMSGETTSELELGDVEPADDGAPLVELRAMSMSGDVRVVRGS